MKVSKRFNKRSIGTTRKTATQRAVNPLLPALIALGGAAILLAKPASGIELGELQINSTLGQPFSASIAYALNPHEELHSYCVSLNRAFDPAVQSLTRAKVTLANGRIVISGNKPINEPMLAMRVTVNCPYTVKLAREYMVMINPAGTAQALPQGALYLPRTDSTATATTVAVERNAAPAVFTTPGRASNAPVSNTDESPIYIGDDYRVQNGDTLSKIANRIDGRPVGLWQAIDAVYQANPEAFVNDDKNHLMAGSLLAIPAMDGHEIVADVATTTDEPAYVAPVAAEPIDAGEQSYAPETSYAAEAGSNFQAYDSNAEHWGGEEVVDGYADEYYSNEYYAGDTELSDSEPVAIEEPVLVDDTAVLTSGNSETVAVEVAATEAETTTRPVAVATPLVTSASNTQPWMMWAAGGTVVLLLGLVFFWRRIRDLSGDEPAERAEPVLEGEDEITHKSHVLSDLDFQLDETSPGEHAMELDADLGDGLGLDKKQSPEIAFAETTELDIAIAASAEVDTAMQLDADLGAGTGLQDGTDLDVAQDFGFSATGEEATPLDLEIPVEVDVEVDDLPTDIIPPHRAEEKSILDKEVLPEENNDDDSQYDLSMIVDATKQALGEADATARDLMAVQLDAGQPSTDDTAYTLSKEVDFKILEQDYEEELTQTQAVNEEIARAAVELAERMEAENDVLDITAEMPSRDKEPAQNDDIIDDFDETGLNEELTLDDDATVEMDPKNKAG